VLGVLNPLLNGNIGEENSGKEIGKKHLSFFLPGAFHIQASQLPLS